MGEGLGKHDEQDYPAENMGGGCGHQLRFFVTWPSPAPSGAPSSCSRYPYPPQQPPSFPPSLAASYTSLPPFLTPTLPLPYIASLHLRVCTHTTNLCVHNLYPTCSNSTRSYLYTLRTTNFCVQPTPSLAYTMATYFAKISPTFDRLQQTLVTPQGTLVSLVLCQVNPLCMNNDVQPSGSILLLCPATKHQHEPNKGEEQAPVSEDERRCSLRVSSMQPQCLMFATGATTRSWPAKCACLWTMAINKPAPASPNKHGRVVVGVPVFLLRERVSSQLV